MLNLRTDIFSSRQFQAGNLTKKVFCELRISFGIFVFCFSFFPFLPQGTILPPSLATGKRKAEEKPLFSGITTALLAGGGAAAKENGKKPKGEKTSF